MSVRDHILEIESEQQSRFIERDDVLRGMIRAILAREHILLLGPPGTAKTLLVHGWAESLGLSFFRRLMNQYTTPDEIVGPVDIPKMKEGTWRRILDGKAADSEIVLLDEVFKAGSTINNTLLALMNERIYDNDGSVHRAPLITLVGCSNELPHAEDGLDAFYDRFLLRYHVSYIDDPVSFTALLNLTDKPMTVAPLARDELVQAHAEIAALPVESHAIEGVKVLWQMMEDNEIIVSDRRFKQMLKVMAAESWLKGEPAVTPESIEVGSDILWSTPDQYPQVKRLCMTSIDPYKVQAKEMYEAVCEAFDDLMAEDIFDHGTGLQVMEQIKTVRNDLSSMNQPHLEKLLDGMSKRIYSKIMGQSDSPSPF